MRKHGNTQEMNGHAQRKLETLRLFVVLFVFSGMVGIIMTYIMKGSAYESALPLLIITLLFGAAILWFIAKAITSRFISARRRAHLYRLRNTLFRHDIGGRLVTVRYGIETSGVEGNESLDIVYRAAAKGIELVHQMKELEKLGGGALVLRAVALRPIFESIGESYDLSISIEGEATVRADDMLKPTLENLIRNAAMHSGTEKVLISISPKDDHVDVAIVDYGKGIPEKVRDKLFNEGFTYGETGKTGLGLYIVKETMKHYGGTVRFEETDPSGATFVLRFQRSEEEKQ